MRGASASSSLAVSLLTLHVAAQGSASTELAPKFLLPMAGRKAAALIGIELTLLNTLGAQLMM